MGYVKYFMPEIGLEENMDNGIPIITAGDGEIVIKQIPGVDIDTTALNEALLTLPAKTFLGLFREMYKGVYGYPPIVNYGGCCCSPEDDAEDNAKYYDKQPAKVEKSYAVGE